ncbi:hypothetical protein ACQEVX_22870 [Streptomyces syringium]|uniref:hypothetical protein n=1 Tax=Streptomyces syringium TaxID=76729 RepID=UPI003D94C5BD
MANGRVGEISGAEEVRDAGCDLVGVGQAPEDGERCVAVKCLGGDRRILKQGAEDGAEFPVPATPVEGPRLLGDARELVDVDGV